MFDVQSFGKERRFVNPEGIQIVQPRVARHELPWVLATNGGNPEGVASNRDAMIQPRWGWKLFWTDYPG
jgi:hypothetical protein